MKRIKSSINCIKGIRREEKRFKDRHKMQYHGMLGLSKAQRNALKKQKERGKL